MMSRFTPAWMVLLTALSCGSPPREPCPGPAPCRCDRAEASWLRLSYEFPFEPGRSDLDETATATADRLVAELPEQHLVFELRVAGGGDREDALALERRRAVRDALRARGLPVTDSPPESEGTPLEPDTVSLWLLVYR